MKCNTCNTEYKVTDYLCDGCAASLYLHNGDYYILAHYSSSYDMRRYALKRDKYEIGMICDKCITDMINLGRAQLIEDGVW